MLNHMFLKRVPLTAVRIGAFLIASPWTPLLRSEPATSPPAPVTIVQADPHHQGTLLAGTATALLFRSRDGANSWTRVPFPGELRSTLHAVMIDPVRANVYRVAVTSELSQYAGLFRSTDEGATWE